MSCFELYRRFIVVLDSRSDCFRSRRRVRSLMRQTWEEIVDYPADLCFMSPNKSSCREGLLTQLESADDGLDMEKMDLEDSTLMEKGKKPPAAAEPPGKFERLYQPCLAELVGTMFFVFIGCVSVIENVPAAGRVQPALVHGLAVAVMVAVMDNISGAHFNPPFTIAIYLCGGMRLPMVAPYLISQLIGGVLGAGMAKLMTPPDRYLNASGAAFDLLRSDAQLSRAIFGEVAMTCLVTMVVLMVAVNGRTKTPLAPFLVGCTVMINILAGGDISGTCLNPARAFGPAVMANYWTYHWVYWVGPIGGGLLAAALIRLVLGDNKLRILMKS